MTIYTNTARFDTGRAMTEQELFRAAPSIFATEAHHSRSERFAPIPTIEIVRGMAKEGFAVVGATQAVARIEDKKPYTKHLLRFRRLDDAAKYTVGGSVMEILLRNGNDGSSAYNLMAGMFRIACMNSLVAQTSTIDEINVRHSGKAFDKVIEGSYEVLKSAEQVMRAPQDWSQIQLSDRHRHAFAVGAHVERFGEDSTTAVKPEQLLIPRRQADTGRDLWSTFNVIQENAVRGGLTARNAETRRRSIGKEISKADDSCASQNQKSRNLGLHQPTTGLSPI
jgi:hypothetical protein